MIERIGKCMYCEQAIMVRVNEDASEAEIDREATMLCKCEMAAEFQKKQTNINEMEAYIKEEYEDTPTIQKYLLQGVRDIGNGIIEKLSINAGQTKYVLSRKGNGQLKMEKNVQIKKVKEQ